MAVTNLFNGKIYVSRSLRVGVHWQMNLAFSDYNNQFKGSDAQIGCVVYFRGMTGQPIRGVVISIESKSASQINCTVETDSYASYIPAQFGAIVKETANNKYPMFPNGIPEAIKSMMLSHYAYLADDNIIIQDSLDILSLPSLRDDMVIRLRMPGEFGSYTEVGTLLGTLARYIRQVEEGDSWTDKVGYVKEDGSGVTVSFDEDGTPAIDMF